MSVECGELQALVRIGERVELPRGAPDWRRSLDCASFYRIYSDCCPLSVYIAILPHFASPSTAPPYIFASTASRHNHHHYHHHYYHYISCMLLPFRPLPAAPMQTHSAQSKIRHSQPMSVRTNSGTGNWQRRSGSPISPDSVRLLRSRRRSCSN